MTITLPLEPQEQAKLNVVAASKGTTADELVSEVVDKIIAEATETAALKQPALSLRGLLAKYGSAPTAVFRSSARSNASTSEAESEFYLAFIGDFKKYRWDATVYYSDFVSHPLRQVLSDNAIIAV